MNKNIVEIWKHEGVYWARTMTRYQGIEGSGKTKTEAIESLILALSMAYDEQKEKVVNLKWALSGIGVGK